jgi:predicted porin
MKKSLIALAVAGAFAAPAFAATGNVDVYGIMNIAIEDQDSANFTPGVIDNVSRIGFKGAEDLGGGLKAVWQIEQGLGGTSAATGVSGTGTLATRNTFIGLAGDFGTFLMGRHDTPYKLGTGSLDIFGDTIADYNAGRLNSVQGLLNAFDLRSPSAIAYVSPTWSGFHFAAAVVAANEGVPADTIDATSITGVYVNGPLFASLSYQSANDVLGAGADVDAWKVGASYTFGDAKVGAIYENVEADTTTQDRTTWIINGVYNLGPIALKAQYADISDANFGVTANGDQSMWAVGADYSLSKRTTAYLVYGNGDSDAAVAAVAAAGIAGSALGDVSGWNVGLKHSF